MKDSEDEVTHSHMQLENFYKHKENIGQVTCITGVSICSKNMDFEEGE